MDSEAIAVARELVACPEFPRPLRDDQPHEGWRDGVYRDDAGIRWVLTPQVVPGGRWLPDLNDKATAGVVLGMLHEQAPEMSVSFDSFTGGWRCGTARPGSGPRRHRVLGVAAGRARLALWRARG